MKNPLPFIKNKKVVGILLVVVGLVGIILPVVPGWWLIFAGLELLGIGTLYINHLRKKAESLLVDELEKKKFSEE